MPDYSGYNNEYLIDHFLSFTLVKYSEYLSFFIFIFNLEDWKWTEMDWEMTEKK